MAKMPMEFDNSDLFVVESATATTSVTFNANTYAKNDIDITKAGYTPIGILGFTTNGTNVTSLIVLEYRVVKSSNTYYSRFFWKNPTNSAITMSSYTADILYKKNN